MAEIKIEEKKTIWPWVLVGLLLLALLLYFVLRNNDEDDLAAQTMQNTTSQAALQDTNTTVGMTGDYTSGSVEDYMAYINAVQPMGLDHNYTNGALMRLANAIQAKAQMVGYNVQADIDQAKQLADKIQKDPLATTHANSIRDAAGILATTMHNMQQAKFPNLSNEAQQVKNAAQSIDPDVLTLEQKEEVKTFFERSGDLLQKMG